MLGGIIDLLACPLCGAALGERPGVLLCEHGHTFDVARQGYVSLLAGDAQLGSADTAQMVAARERFLATGHFDGLAEALADAVATAVHGTEGAIADVGAGTGYYLARVLDHLPGQRGIALDLSKYAARRAVRSSENLGAVVCDVWRGLPIRSGVVAAVTNVFAPRNGSEMARVLANGGALVVVTPNEEHLAEVVGPLGLLTVDASKTDRVDATLSPHFELAEERLFHTVRMMSGAEVADLVQMGPSARHVDAGVAEKRIADLEPPVDVTISVRISTYRPR